MSNLKTRRVASPRSALRPGASTPRVDARSEAGGGSTGVVRQLSPRGRASRRSRSRRRRPGRRHRHAASAASAGRGPAQHLQQKHDAQTPMRQREPRRRVQSRLPAPALARGRARRGLARRAADLGGQRHRLLERQRQQRAGVVRVARGAVREACRTTTNSPRPVRVAASQADSAAGSATVSNCLVSSRQTVSRRAGQASPSAAASDSMRCGASNSTWAAAPRRIAPAPGALGAARRQEADDREAGSTGVAGDREGGERAARARDRHDPVAGVARRGDQRRPRVAHRRRAGVADVGHPLAAAEPLEHGAGGIALVVLVHREQRLGEAEVLEQRGRCAGCPRRRSRRPSRARAGRESSGRPGCRSAWRRHRAPARDTAGRRGRSRGRLTSIERSLRCDLRCQNHDASLRRPRPEAMQPRRGARPPARGGLVPVERNYRVARGPRRAAAKST